MSRINELLKAYANHIAIPWRKGAAPGQRVIFCIYDADDERKLLARLGEFELATRNAGHAWLNYDLARSFGVWLASHEYANEYFRDPELLAMILPGYLDFLEEDFRAFTEANSPVENAVIGMTSTGSLFGLLRVREATERLAPHAQGRLAAFFPGSYEANNYRLFDAYDGWNYLALPLKAGMD